MTNRKLIIISSRCNECGGGEGATDGTGWEPVEDDNGPIVDDPPPAEEE